MKTKSLSAKLFIRERNTIFVVSVIEVEKIRKVCQASHWGPVSVDPFP